MGFIYGAIQTQDKPLKQLSDADLLGDVVRVSHALNIGLYALADDKEPNRSQIAQYSPVQSNGDTKALIAEARTRAPGSAEVREFLGLVDKAISENPSTRTSSEVSTNFALVIPAIKDPAVTQYLPRTTAPFERPVPGYMYS